MIRSCTAGVVAAIGASARDKGVDSTAMGAAVHPARARSKSSHWVRPRAEQESHVEWSRMMGRPRASFRNAKSRRTALAPAATRGGSSVTSQGWETVVSGRATL